MPFISLIVVTQYAVLRLKRLDAFLFRELKCGELL